MDEIGEKEYYNEYYNSFVREQVGALNLKVDYLTGFRNILAFEEELEKASWLTDNKVCTVAVFDIIGLQDVNRGLGRIEGDKRIRSLAQSVFENMPRDSVLFRGYDAEIIAVCRNKKECDVIRDIEAAVKSCPNPVAFGVASTDRLTVDIACCSGNKGVILQALEQAQYDLNVRKMLHEESARSQTLTTLARALEEVDKETEEHVRRTCHMGVALGKRLGLTDTQLTILELLCLMHDIGILTIPLDIFKKPGKLTEAEWTVLKSHSEKGYQIALASKEFKPIAECILYHHERWDGNGYPTGLAGNDIPVLSRIISVVDAYDAMVNDRCYRKAQSPEYAMKEIRDNAGTQFDPVMAGAFLELLSEDPDMAMGKKAGGEEIRIFKKTSEQIADAVNTRPVVYCEYKLDVDDRIIETDPSFSILTGYSQDDILGKMRQFDLIPPEDLSDYEVQVGNQFAKSDTAFLRHRLRRKDGSVISVICHSTRKFDSATRTYKCTVQIYEVAGDENSSLRYRLEETEKIREMNQTITSLLDNIPGMAFTKDAKTGVYLACNQAFAEYAHKAKPEGVVGLRDSEIFDAETAAHFVEDDKMALSMDKPFIFFEDVPDAVGNQRQFQTTKLKYIDSTGRLCLQGMCQDVTDMIRIRSENATTKEAYEKARDTSIIYNHLAHALARGCGELYYVNLESGDFIEFHTDDSLGVLSEARRSTDFFGGCEQDAGQYVYPEDQAKFIETMNKDFLEAALQQSKVYEIIYRRIKGNNDDNPYYVSMKITRMEDDARFIVIAVFDIDELMRQRRAEARIREERIVYARLHALTGNFLCIFVVDPETDYYREFSSTENYAKNFAQAREGTDFFAAVREAARVFNCKGDLKRFLTVFTKENILTEIERSGIFTLGYRVKSGSRNLHVQMKAAMVEEKEGLRLIVGLYDIDAQVRQEKEFGRRLEEAQNQANIDALTGVKNRHAFLTSEVRMDSQIAEHSQPPFAIVIFDVNDLKKVNDTYGHKAGDEYLRGASKIISDIFKKSVVFRVGGDEFAVISMGKDYTHIEELIAEMAGHNLEASENGGIVIACGMARYQNDDCVATVFERADHAMYENKNYLKTNLKRHLEKRTGGVKMKENA